ncbi:hypothetical protein D3C84_1220180 [compost metagenome]
MAETIIPGRWIGCSDVFWVEVVIVHSICAIELLSLRRPLSVSLLKRNQEG